MPYDIKLTQINTATFGIGAANTVWGFPANTNFHTLLMSYWMCGPVAPLGGFGACAIYPAFKSADFFNFQAGANGIAFTNPTLGAAGQFYQGGFDLPLAGCLSHILLSVDTHAQVVQLYINDRSVPVIGGTWTGAQPLNFNITSAPSIWFWDVANVPLSTRNPALADAWISNTPAFVDLSVTANRRKFINRDLSPVDLGDTGTNPFGYQPAMYMSVRPGGVPTDIAINRGGGGGTWTFSGGATPTFQAPGSCTLPPPPPPLLAMDNVIATASQTLLPTNLISLRWSDDRGHTWGHPVTIPIGEAGEFRTSLQWQRLGMARDRVFEIYWDVPMRTALQGCWLDATPAQS